MIEAFLSQNLIVLLILKAGTLRMLSYLTLIVVQIFKRYKLKPLYSVLHLVGLKIHHLFFEAPDPQSPKLLLLVEEDLASGLYRLPVGS